ncbi:MAG: DUF1080 domain-containing protein, partial [Planctomycetota bacterium]|nr:DUF1080 domain-containing protein [Planctomycetota bacterium]
MIFTGGTNQDRGTLRTYLVVGLVLFGLYWLISGGAVAQGETSVIQVDTSQITGPASRFLSGACLEDVNHEIYGGLYSQMIFGESFQEPEPPPAIVGFQSYGGDWKTLDGTLIGKSKRAAKLVYQREPFQDGAVKVDLRFTTDNGPNAGVLVRVSSPGMGVDMMEGYEVSLHQASQTLRLIRHCNTPEPLEEVPCVVPVGEWIRLEVRILETRIDVSVAGKSLLSHDLGAVSIGKGRIGLRIGNRETHFRNLEITVADRAEAINFALSERPIDGSVSGMWRAVRRGTARGEFALDTNQPFVGRHSQQIRFDAGVGRWGIDNQSLNRWGMNFVAGKSYEGLVWVRADRPTKLYVSLENHDGTAVLAETTLGVHGTEWQRIDFELTPTASDLSGRVSFTIGEPATVWLGYVFLQPGSWGRYKDLPVRRDVAEGLVSQGITLLRCGGSMVNNPEYRWKNMIGPRDKRPPYRGVWYPYSSNGWGILDFMNFCEAAGFEYIPAFCLQETPQDMAEFVEYTKSPVTTAWGRRRAEDGHPEPYKLPYIELGNEENVDEAYVAQFAPLAEAIWAKDPDVTLIVGDFCYTRPIEDPMSFPGSLSDITSLAAHKKILELAGRHRREVWFDVHLDTTGPGASDTLKALPSYIDALAKIAKGTPHRVVVLELNAVNHEQRRALANATAIGSMLRDGRVAFCASANCLQPDRQNDSGWDQGLLFLTPSQVWLQPPGYVTQIVSQYLPGDVVKVDVEHAGGLDVTAILSMDRKALTLQVVHVGNKSQHAAIRIEAFA